MDERIINTFKLRGLTTLSNSLLNVQEIELSFKESTIKGCQDAVDQASMVILKLLKDKRVWLRIILWDETNTNILKNEILLPIFENLKSSKIEDGSLVLFYYFDLFDITKVESIIKSSIYYDQALLPSINSTCFYFSFDDNPTIINIYDDRGMHVITTI